MRYATVFEKGDKSSEESSVSVEVMLPMPPRGDGSDRRIIELRPSLDLVAPPGSDFIPYHFSSNILHRDSQGFVTRALVYSLFSSGFGY